MVLKLSLHSAALSCASDWMAHITSRKTNQIYQKRVFSITSAHLSSVLCPTLDGTYDQQNAGDDECSPSLHLLFKCVSGLGAGSLKLCSLLISGCQLSACSVGTTLGLYISDGDRTKSPRTKSPRSKSPRTISPRTKSP